MFCSAVKQAASSEDDEKSGEVLAKDDKEDDEDAHDIGQGKPTRRQVAVSNIAFCVCGVYDFKHMNYIDLIYIRYIYRDT